MPIIPLLQILRRILFFPIQPHRPVRPFRCLLRSSRLFGLASMALQVRDLARVSKIDKVQSTNDEFYVAVHDYNAGVTQRHVVHTTRRAEEFYQMLDLPPRDVADEKLLVVGPRNIAELYIAWLYGFSWRNIMGIDLYSTNPKIQVMNMEDMAFDDATFDAVTMSATLAYAKDVPGTIEEVYRVLKPGGRFCFGGTYAPESKLWSGDDVSGDELRAALANVGFHIYVYRASTKINSLGQKQTSHRVGAYRPDPDQEDFDHVVL